ncbi:MAG: DUF2155 domain-containing protein [Erythrobacter sp.]|nr:DUF2155 domain-containing protein [Erythrobacter sp.]
MGPRAFSCLAAFAVALSGCGEEEAEPADEAPAATDIAETPPQAEAGAAPPPGEEVEGATPMAKRVATIGLLNKRNNVSREFELSPGESAEEGPVILRLEACERTAPYEFPQETGAFVQVDVRGRGASEHSRVFSGWLFKESPSLNVVEHPIYDVWVKDCAISFPGDE